MADGTSNKKRAMKAAKIGPLARKNTKARHLEILYRAVQVWLDTDYRPDSLVDSWAEDFYGITHAVVFKVLAGRQNEKNAAKALNDGVLATARKIRSWKP